MVLNERDYLIMQEIHRWKTCGSRHIKYLANFSGQRATDRRLKALIDCGYVERSKFLYGVPSIYYLTNSGKALIGATKKVNKIRIDQIIHDMNVIDTAIYFMKTKNIDVNKFTTRKELHCLDGFGVSKHNPDFIFQDNDKTNCVEVEMSLKAKTRLETIVKYNCKYNTQFWVVPKALPRLHKILDNFKTTYNNLEIVSLEEIKKYLTTDPTKQLEKVKV